MIDYEVRPAVREDVIAAGSILEQVMAVQRPWHDERSESYADKLRHFFDNGFYANVVERSGVVVGFVACEERDSRMHITYLYLDQQAQGYGIGQHLIEDVSTFGRSNGFEELSLMVDVENTDARRFYDRLGFCALGEPQSAWYGAAQTMTLDVT